MEEHRFRTNVVVKIRRLQRERGAIAILTALVLIVVLGFVALALDLAQLYNRKVEMENVAATSALAAATSLNGTADGVTAAIAAAASRVADQPPIGLTYDYNKGRMKWSNEAIQFSASPHGAWVDATGALANPAGLLFAKVDTSKLNAAYGQVPSMFIRVVIPDLFSSSTSATATAGRSAINILPLGVCAMRPELRHNRSGELVELGFRRGVSYDLMQLNPDRLATKGQTFLVNPTAAPGTAGTSPHLDVVKPFICTGTMSIPRVSDKELAVESPFPLNALFGQLNSRFDSYVSPCNPYTAPPDLNVRSFLATAAGVPWMGSVPTGQSAALSTVEQRWTVADPEPTPFGTVATDFGPLWSYARAAKYAAAEPVAGYATFELSDWKTLYIPAMPTPSGYPSGTPYAPTSSFTVQFPPSGRKGVAGRRVLNISLLSCPVTGNKAQVMGVGRFFMTVPATTTSLHAEFAGLISDQKLGHQVELYK